MNFAGANLNVANFHRSNLEGASFSGAIMCGTVLRKSVLNEADFQDASLSNAILRKSFAERARFDNASLKDADLSKVYFEDASFREGDLRGSNLRKAKLKGADLRGARLDGANVIKADLSHANLADASLRGADLAQAMFSYTNLYGVALDGSDGISVFQRAGIIELPGDEFAATSDVTKLANVSEQMTTDVSPANAEQTTDAESSSAAAGEPVEPVMSVATAGNYRIQVGAFREKNTALSTWTNLSNQYPSVFGGYDAITEPANLGVEQGTWYRLQVVSFESKAQAAAFCDRYKLAQQGAACFPVLAP